MFDYRLHFLRAPRFTQAMPMRAPGISNDPPHREGAGDTRMVAGSHSMVQNESFGRRRADLQCATYRGRHPLGAHPPHHLARIKKLRIGNRSPPSENGQLQLSAEWLPGCPSATGWLCTAPVDRYLCPLGPVWLKILRIYPTWGAGTAEVAGYGLTGSYTLRAGCLRPC